MRRGVRWLMPWTVRIREQGSSLAKAMRPVQGGALLAFASLLCASFVGSASAARLTREPEKPLAPRKALLQSDGRNCPVDIASQVDDFSDVDKHCQPNVEGEALCSGCSCALLRLLERAGMEGFPGPDTARACAIENAGLLGELGVTAEVDFTASFTRDLPSLISLLGACWSLQVLRSMESCDSLPSSFNCTLPGDDRPKSADEVDGVDPVKGQHADMVISAIAGVVALSVPLVLALVVPNALRSPCPPSSGIASARLQCWVKGSSERSSLLLQPTNFVLKPGEVVGVAGDSGAGKTTFLSCMAGECPGQGTLISGCLYEPGIMTTVHFRRTNSALISATVSAFSFFLSVSFSLSVPFFPALQIVTSVSSRCRVMRLTII